jgi:hypothetical protein
MKTTFKIERPDDIEVTLTTTMTLRNWRSVQADIKCSNYPATCFAQSIREVVSKAEQQFNAVHPEAPQQ